MQEAPSGSRGSTNRQAVAENPSASLGRVCTHTLGAARWRLSKASTESTSNWIDYGAHHVSAARGAARRAAGGGRSRPAHLSFDRGDLGAARVGS